MKKRISVIFSITILLGIVLCGCNSNNESNNNVSTKTDVEKYYEVATNLKKEDLTVSNGKWEYKGIPLLPDDQDWLNSSLNKEGIANQSAIYDKMAKLLEGFDLKINSYKTYAEILIGFVPETRDEFVPYANKAKTFITTKDSLKNVMKAFESLDCVQGTFDYDYEKLGKYELTINDLSKCAEDLKISQEMLGYTIGMLTVYAPTIEFSGNNCHINYEGFK